MLPRSNPSLALQASMTLRDDREFASSLSEISLGAVEK